MQKIFPEEVAGLNPSPSHSGSLPTSAACLELPPLILNPLIISLYLLYHTLYLKLAVGLSGILFDSSSTIFFLGPSQHQHFVTLTIYVSSEGLFPPTLTRGTSLY